MLVNLRSRVIVPICGLLILLATIPLAPGILSAGVGLRYVIAADGYNDSVRVAPVDAMMIPRIVVGPQQPSGMSEVYVLGLNPPVNCTPPTNSTCPLVVAKSNDGGRSFDAPYTTSTDVPGWSVDALVLPNGTIVAASWGPWILVSSDGGGAWNVTAELGNASAPASLTRDAVTGVLYAVWPTITSWEFVQGPFLMSSSPDGGYEWSPPTQILPPTPGGLSPAIAAYDSHVVVALNYGVSPNFVAVMRSDDGGKTWSGVTDLSGPNVTYQAPSVVVSTDGVLAVSWGEGGSILAAISRDGGLTWDSPLVVSGAPGGGCCHSAVFDSRGRFYTTWTSSAGKAVPGTLYVASSDRSLTRFNTSSFSVTFQSSLPTDVWYQNNLAAGSGGNVLLAWVSSDPSTENATRNGIFVRSVSGAVQGLVEVPNLPPGQLTTVELHDLSTGGASRTANWTGGALEFVALAPSDYDVIIETGNTSHDYGSLPVRVWGLTSFTVGVVPASESAEIAWEAGVAFAAGVFLLAATSSALQYTRLAKDNILQRKVRALICEYVRDNPGSSFSSIRSALGLQNGVAAYHLAVLEKQGMLHSKTRRRHRWYYPEGNISSWEEVPLSPIQGAILEAVQESPGAGVRDIARRTGQRPSSVAYNLKGLAREGVVRQEKSGRRVRYFAMAVRGTA